MRKFFNSNKETILQETLEHGVGLHAPISSSDVTLSPFSAVQLSPPYAGAGLSHKRVLV